jgi:putative transposase
MAWIGGSSRSLPKLLKKWAASCSTEVMPDHVHLLIDVDPKLGLHRVVKAI